MPNKTLHRTAIPLRSIAAGELTRSASDVILMAPAVSDFRVAQPAAHKLKTQGQTVILEVLETADFLVELPDTLVKVGFAAETQDLLENARPGLQQWPPLNQPCRGAAVPTACRDT